MKRLPTTILSLYLAASASLAGGCASMRADYMTPQELGAHGSHTFTASPTDTFKATIGALQTLGYELTVVNEEKGIIKTNRKPLRAQAVATSSYSATAVRITRQYYLRLTSPDGAATTVVADPRVFIGERDASGDKVWALDGPEGERELWRRLFAEIQSNL